MIREILNSIFEFIALVLLIVIAIDVTIVAWDVHDTIGVMHLSEII